MTKTTFKGRKTPTPKQSKLIKLLLDNLGNKGRTRTLGEMMIEAGYTKDVADNPFLITNSPTIQNGLKEFTDKLKLTRDKAIGYLDDDNKLKKSNARDLASIVDILTKNHQLLGGEPTERIKITDEDRKLIDDAFDS